MTEHFTTFGRTGPVEGALAAASLVALHLLVALATWYAASMVQYLFHRHLGHGRALGVVHRRHVGGHHAHYASRMTTPSYRRPERAVTPLYLLPVGLLALATSALLPASLALTHVATLALSFAVHVALHADYHLERPRLERFAWFRRARARHFLHHRDPRVNFGVLHFAWDRLWGTLREAGGRDR